MGNRAGETIGQRLRRLREERGLTQRQLSAKGASSAYISRIELEQRSPSMKALRLLAPKLGVSPEYLETGQKPKKPKELKLEELMEKIHDLFPEEPVLLLSRGHDPNLPLSHPRALRIGISDVIHTSDSTAKKN